MPNSDLRHGSQLDLHPSFFDEDFSSESLRAPINNNSSLLSIFNDMNKIMAVMHQRFQRLFGSSSFSMSHMNGWLEDRKILDSIKSVCTTTTNLPATMSGQKNRRKKFRSTQTTTCIKELTSDGKKQIYKETNVTDDNGVLISQSKIFQTVSIDTTNNTMSMSTDINSEKDVIAY